MKLSLKHTLLTSALLLTGMSVSLRGNLSEDITNWLLKDWQHKGERQEICQNIGRKGVLLKALPKKTREAILDKCEAELLGLRTPAVSSGPDSVLGMDKDTHPNAWHALAKNTAKWPKKDSITLADDEFAPYLRRQQLKAARKAGQGKSSAESAAESVAKAAAYYEERTGKSFYS